MKESDPALYRELSTPLPMAEAEVSMQAFFAEFYELRKKHHVPDALVIAKINVIHDDGIETPVMVKMHAGSQLEQEGMAAWAYGKCAAERQEMIGTALHETASIRGQKNRP